ncbi:MAG: 6-phosphogluconolactonase [Candidatus Levybacteria bacterium]|nr:6-phosphogluconolactonase [Candidatus Levybacteria bacterium]
MKVKKVTDPNEGFLAAKDILYKVVNRDTALFLSGGSTPKPLYEILAKERKIEPGAVTLVDERFGQPLHLNSNEKMIQETGLSSYFLENGIPYYPILQKGRDRKKVAFEYNAVVSSLFSRFSKRVAILGIGEDGHIAGIPPRNEKLKIKNEKFVESFDNFPGEFKQRISLTFVALSKMTLLIVLVFGGNKKEALRKMFTPGTIEEVPARFYLRKDITKKALLITDQKV